MISDTGSVPFNYDVWENQSHHLLAKESAGKSDMTLQTFDFI